MTVRDFTQIPILDLSLGDDPATLPELLSCLRTALTDVGFLYVSNHGVSASLIAELVRVLRPLFDLPPDAKASIALENSPHFLGYSGTGSETTAGSADQREQVELATELDAGSGAPYERLRGPNQWPCQLPELRPIVERYIEELTHLGERFLRLVAKALSLPDETFFSYLSDQHRLKLVRYPASSNTLGVGPHKDSSGWWTFLLQASPEVKGLQVLNKAGAWVDVPEVPGTFVVNIGQAFEVVTHGTGNEYSYIHIPATQKTTLLLLHGFPSTASDWVHQIQYFSAKGYGIVAPDLLGYGQSSKPTDVSKYRLKPMGDELVELLDNLGLSQVVGIGHDFGSTLLSRLAAYHPSRWTALVFLAVGPPRLGTPFNVKMINQMTKQMMGFELLGYIPWLAGDAQATLEQHAESAMSLMFCHDHKEWDEWFHPLGKMELFVTENRRVPVGSWYSEALQKKHLEAFGAKDGYKGVTRWYRMWLENLFAQDEVGFDGFQTSQPALFVVPREPESSAAQQQQMLAAWTPNLQTVKTDSGHWVHLERPDETNVAIQDFLVSL
ncbi:hypothetical protein BGZ61DRAFT_492869 [Ilyonectria robusta]|uniref:uncharacterized protein n=1 Tax=Ilyonectria robusta TaxID=1079257 RepID=UPI001E8ECD97|nr:uncharacterized protein BGZ61DRAFT_492869 [Ilyonectria robusta]KAH8714402.1 hypothetical protein BGZ61DRAFT_492869 [Ilyonectria robusta]